MIASVALASAALGWMFGYLFSLQNIRTNAIRYWDKPVRQLRIVK